MDRNEEKSGKRKRLECPGRRKRDEKKAGRADSTGLESRAHSKRKIKGKGIEEIR
ncbi:hypothetical protein HMPREF9141_2282 [Prevotella multiformis DSM 16608]|uniref:Uncharacterized protein n=1 Tax=Prevotella multiformis DSM 16608 TaxID=888743 RepID=F0F9L5_9BACT|nr:hypothetical protein HMPREF9141_2282 [Prevotella multiformis DSM 16608]